MKRETWFHFIQRRFQLSPGESWSVADLILGYRQAEIAVIETVHLETIRSRLKSARHKVATQLQEPMPSVAKLISRVMGLRIDELEARIAHLEAQLSAIRRKDDLP